MDNLVGDTTGLIHLVSSIIALLTGSYILVAKKGTKSHVQIGYIYVVSMLVLCGTGFMIYRLFDGWGIFHYTTIVSVVTLALGMIPIRFRASIQSWRSLHFSFMYWSVIGLYAAFVAEILTRIPSTPFFSMVGISIGVVMLVGGVVFGIKKESWENAFNRIP